MPMGGNYRPLGGGYLGNPNRPFQQPTITNEWGYRGVNPFARGFLGDSQSWKNYGIQYGTQGNYSNPYLYYLNNPVQLGQYFSGFGQNLNPYQQQVQSWFPRFNPPSQPYLPYRPSPNPLIGYGSGVVGDTGNWGTQTTVPTVVPPVDTPVKTEPEPYKPWLPPRQEQPDPIVPPIVPPSNGVVTPYRPPNRPPIRRGW